MAHNVEPMDIDNIDCDFDNKENSIQHSNVYPRTPCTEKGYEELDVSELNMKLRYSVTPAASPMSKSFTANCGDNRLGDETLNANLTRSLHSAMTKCDNKSVKTLPLQSITSEPFVDSTRNSSVLRPLDSTIAVDGNVTVTVTQSDDNDENLSIPSSSSSQVQTPEATTPTKEMPVSDGGSPIMRGLKSVLNMFRSSQSPIPPNEDAEITGKQVLSPADVTNPESSIIAQAVLASTPISTPKHKDNINSSKRNSPHKESLVFNDDLEKELLWKDETTILFSQEKIPIHKLFLQQTPNLKNIVKNQTQNVEENMNSSVEYMDISYNDSVKNKTLSDLRSEGLNESDGEFVDCETTFTDDKSDNKDTSKTEIEAIVGREETDLNVVNNTVNIEAPANIALSQSNEALRTELPQSNATITIPDEINENHINKPVIEQVIEEINANTETVAKKAESSENMANTSSIDIINQTKLINKLDDNKTIILDTKNITFESKPRESIPLQSDNIMMNMTFESCNAPVEEHVLSSKNQAGNATIVFSASNNDMNTSPPGDVSKEIIVPDVCNATFNSGVTPTLTKEAVTEQSDVRKTAVTIKSENTTYVKGIEHVSDITQVIDTATPVKIEDKTFISADQNVESAGNTMNTKDENSALSEPIINDPIDSQTFNSNVGYNIFVKEIEKESPLQEKNNTSTPSTEIDFRGTPADIPLPDEDDIETDKSLVSSMLDEEKTVPAALDIINTTVTMLKNENNIEEMPIKIAKSLEDSVAINQIEDRDPLGCLDIDGVKIKENVLENINKCDSGISEILPQNVPANVDVTIAENHEITKVQTITESHDIIELNLGSSVVEKSVFPNQENNVLEEINASQILSELIKIESIQTNQVSLDVVGPKIVDENISSEEIDNLEIHVTKSEEFRTEPQASEAIVDMNYDITEKELILSEQNTITVNNVENETKAAISLPPNQECVDNIVLQSIAPENQIYEKLPECSSTSQNLNHPITVKTTVTETDKAINDNLPFPCEQNKKDSEVMDNLVEEIVLSENNSPFMSIAGEINTIPTHPTSIDETINPFATKSRIVQTPPTSPKIVSKGYNFNFDEIDDPFATKTKIRVSPTPESSPKESKNINRTYEESASSSKRDIHKNRRKSQPERKKPLVAKKKFNSTFSGPVKQNNFDDKTNVVNTLPLQNESNNSITFKNHSLTENKTDDFETDTKSSLDTTRKIDTVTENRLEVIDGCAAIELHKEQKSLDERDIDTTAEVITCEENISETEIPTIVAVKESKTSSSEQSAYYSAASSEGDVSKNVFNLPEIDDVNFNPFVTKSKMRQSPPPDLIRKETKSDITYTEENKIDSSCVEDHRSDDKECASISNVTCSSKATDEKDITVCDVHTEDEDTEEGPFFEPDDNDKISDFDGEDVDMMQFTEIPPQNNDENEMFIDAEAFEFLLNQNKSNVVSDSGKESLFLKFDPLFAKRVSSDGVLAALNKVQKRQSTPKKVAPILQMNETFDKAIAGPSNLNVTQEVVANVTAEETTEDLNVTVCKPMMVVTPAVNPVVTPRNKITTPTSSNRRSITFTSPAIAVIDRLLCLSANNSLVSHDSTVSHVNREQNEADLALTQLRELLAEKEISVYNLRSESKELKDRLSSLESQMRTLETESEERLRKVNELNEKLNEKTKLNKSMAAVVEEYERTIASLIAETEQDKKRHNEERIQLIKERDEQTAHLASMEVSFSDLHSKYEKSKQIILTCKANEDSYKKSIKEFEENLAKMQANYELLKQHATSKLNHANQELEKMNRAHESEILKMNAMIKRKELHITSLEETLAQKTKANEELTAICDELINKVG